MSEKKELRKRCTKKVNALSQDYYHEADGKIFSAVLGLLEYRNAETAFRFVGMWAEIQIASLIEEMLRADKQVAVSHCTGKGVMHARVIRSLAELRPGTMGILEPLAEVPVLSPEGLDLILLPCVSASRSGERLSYGGNSYDHYLPKTKAFRVLSIRKRLLSGDIPRGAHDQPVDTVITEAGIFRRTQSESEGVF